MQTEALIEGSDSGGSGPTENLHMNYESLKRCERMLYGLKACPRFIGDSSVNFKIRRIADSTYEQQGFYVSSLSVARSLASNLWS